MLRDEEADSKAQIEQVFSKAGLKVPLLKDVLASLPVDKVRAQKIVTLLLRDRVLIKLGDELVFHRDALAGLKAADRGAKVEDAEAERRQLQRPVRDNPKARHPAAGVSGPGAGHAARGR